MSFGISLSGLDAASSDLDVIANNISNSNTIGFKDSRANFSDVYAAGSLNLSANQITEEGVNFQSPADGSRMLLTPERSIQVTHKKASIAYRPAEA